MRHFGQTDIGAGERATTLEDVPCGNKNMQTSMCVCVHTQRTDLYFEYMLNCVFTCKNRSCVNYANIHTATGVTLTWESVKSFQSPLEVEYDHYLIIKNRCGVATEIAMLRIIPASTG